MWGRSCLDAASSEQTWWMGAVTDAIKMKTMVEQWLQDIEDQEVQKLHQNLDQEFLVTKTIGNAEVWADFQAWRPSSQQSMTSWSKKCVMSGKSPRTSSKRWQVK
jgi:hypothetical protein